MNVLVCGGAGYIGSHVIQLLLRKNGVEITVVDNLSTGFKLPILNNFLIQIDLSDKNAVEAIFAENKFDVVMHFAGSTVISESLDNPLKYYINNTISTINLLELCNKYNVKKFIYSSTAAVYGESSESVVNENSSVNPTNPYGMSKLMSEKIIEDNARANKDFRYCILRYFNVAGSDVNGEIGQNTKNATHLIKIASQVALGKRNKMQIYGDNYDTKDGTCIRDYIHVSDLAQAHIDSLDYLSTNKGGIFNCGYGHGYSVYEVVDMMKKVSGIDFKVEIEGKRSGDITALISDNTKIINKMKWKPKYDSLELICKTAYEWEKKTIAWIN